MAANKDTRFAMAHARLAEAWSELDFTGNAQQEMLEASTLEQKQHLPELDARYIHAVRDTLTHDYAGAAQEYRSILLSLPDSEKADGYVDLGRAYQKQGHIPEATASYQMAAKLAPDSPAAYIHIATGSRLQKRNLADAAFTKAEAIYRTEVNEEGLAEVAYQRGYAANDRGDSTEAEKYLNQSIEVAKQIPSVQMEIRALTQLSDVHSEAGDDKTAAAEANRAIQLAEENGLTYWWAVGLVRLGGTYLYATDPARLTMAEQPLEEAIRIAQDGHHSRPEAEAKLNLASLRDRQHKPYEVIPLARDARDIYAATALASALDASTLLVRGQVAEGDLSGALRSSSDLLSSATASGSLREKMLAEELIASVLRELERYPEALEHYQKALAASRTQPEKIFEQINCSRVFGRLGLFAEAEKILSSLPPQSEDYGSLAAVRARTFLDQKRYDAALSEVEKSIGSAQEDGRENLQLTAAVAELHLGRRESASKRVSEVLAEALDRKDIQAENQAKLVQIRLFLSEKSLSEARNLATEMSQYFHSSGQRESELLSLYYLAISQRQLGNRQASAEAAAKAIDIFRGWEQSWSPPLIQSYRLRADSVTMLRDLQQCKNLR